jgi:hypothetical protein
MKLMLKLKKCLIQEKKIKILKKIKIYNLNPLKDTFKNNPMKAKMNLPLSIKIHKKILQENLLKEYLDLKYFKNHLSKSLKIKKKQEMKIMMNEEKYYFNKKKKM